MNTSGAGLFCLFLVFRQATGHVYSGTVYVYYPDDFWSGGPAALHHLHHSLNRLGMQSKMTVHPYYRNNWSRSFSRLPDPVALTSGDILILPSSTTTLLSEQEILSYTQRGILVFGYALAICPPPGSIDETNISELPLTGQDLSGQNLDGLLQLIPVGHYVLEYYDMPIQSSLYLLPPLQNIFYHRAQQYKSVVKRENLVLIDQDSLAVFLPPYCAVVSKDVALDLSRQILGECNFIVLDGFSVEEMITLYRRAKIVYDNFLNGPERTVQEGILFDAYPVVSIEGNGFDKRDFNLPSFALSSPTEGPSTVKLIELLLQNHESMRHHFAPFKNAVWSLAKTYDARLTSMINAAAFVFVFDVDSRLIKRPDTKDKGYNSSHSMIDRNVREQNIIASVVSILFHMPAARIVLNMKGKEEVLSFCSRWQHVLRHMEAHALFRKNSEAGFALTILAQGVPWSKADILATPISSANIVGQPGHDDFHVEAVDLPPILLEAQDALSAGFVATTKTCQLYLTGTQLSRTGCFSLNATVLAVEPGRKSASSNCAKSSTSDIVRLDAFFDRSDACINKSDSGHYVPLFAVPRLESICERLQVLHESPLGRIANVFADHFKMCIRMNLLQV